MSIPDGIYISPYWKKQVFGYSRIGDIVDVRVFGFGYFRLGTIKSLYLPFRNKAVAWWGKL